MTWVRNPISEKQLKSAARRYVNGETMKSIALSFGVKPDWLKCLLDPEHKEKRLKRRREAARIARRKAVKDTRPIFHPDVRDHVVVPREVLIEKDHAASQPRSISAMLMGDPLPGRSALDRRNSGQHQYR